MANEKVTVELTHVNNGWTFLIASATGTLNGHFAAYDEPEYYTTVSLAIDAAKALIAAQVTEHIT